MLALQNLKEKKKKLRKKYRKVPCAKLLIKGLAWMLQ